MESAIWGSAQNLPRGDPIALAFYQEEPGGEVKHIILCPPEPIAADRLLATSDRAKEKGVLLFNVSPMTTGGAKRTAAADVRMEDRGRVRGALWRWLPTELVVEDGFDRAVSLGAYLDGAFGCGLDALNPILAGKTDRWPSP
jgi:hypothetical protein